MCVPHCFFLFWGSVRSPLIFNVLHQHRPHMVPDLHANKNPASSAKHMNPDLHANKSPASTAKHTYHLHCTQLNYKTQKHYMTECKCSLCSLMPVNSFPNVFLLQMQHSTGGHDVQKSNCFPFLTDNVRLCHVTCYNALRTARNPPWMWDRTRHRQFLLWHAVAAERLSVWEF